MEDGLNPLKKLEEIDKEVPGNDHTEVVIRIVIPVVVDVEAVLIEVAHARVVTIGSPQILLVLIFFHRKSSFTFAGANYLLSFFS